MKSKEIQSVDSSYHVLLFSVRVYIYVHVIDI